MQIRQPGASGIQEPVQGDDGMRKIAVRTIPAVAITVMMLGVVPPIFASYGNGGGALPNAGVPIITGYDIDAIGRVLDTISSPAQRDALAINWVAFAKQAISKSLDMGQQWIDIQKAQLQSQSQAGQYQAELLKMQMQIEQLHKENLALENENLKMRLQLQQQPGSSPTPKPQSP